ncbi:MAG: hypothetical protein IT458_15555 [Planctomycetes bacterium]|nr:hypothetical protein [Planctomycetota bacterium]
MRAVFLPLAALLVPALVAGQSTRPASEWPKLERAAQERVQQLFENLARNEPELTAKAEQELLGLGPAAAPLLLNRISDQPTNFNASLCLVLDATTRVEHTALLARFAKDRRVNLRRYVVERLALLPDPAMRPVLEAATKDKDAEVVFRAHLGLVAIGQWSSLEPVFERAQAEWREMGALIHRATAPARGPAPSQWLLDRMARGEVRTKVAGLRMLRALGAKESAPALRPYLTTEEHLVKKEAINALRVMVDGEKPLEDLSVFQAIEMAKTWSARL